MIARDIWFDGFVESDANDFIQIVKLTYKRFASNFDLRERIEQSKDVKVLVNLSRKTLEFAIRREFDEVLEYQPEKEIRQFCLNKLNDKPIHGL